MSENMGKAITLLEQTAIEALLSIFTALSPCSSPLPSSPKQLRSKRIVFTKPEVSSSVSPSSEITSESLCRDGDSEIQASKLDFLSTIASAYETSFKVFPKLSVRAPRSQITRRKSVTGGWGMPFSPPATSEEVSSLQSSSSSCVSYEGRTLREGRHRFKPASAKKKPELKQKARAIYNSPTIRRLAERILKFLSVGPALELKIRDAVGNSPDTSKALRMLLRLKEVKRAGVGGPSDPFQYSVTLSSKNQRILGSLGDLSWTCVWSWSAITLLAL